MPDYATHDAAEQAILDRSVLRAGGTTITPSAVDVVGLIVQGSAGQTGHLLQTKNSDGTDLVYIGARGPVIIQPQVDAGASSVAITQGNPAQRALLIKGAASQTANLQEFHNSSGSVLSKIYSDGSLQAAASFIGVGATYIGAQSSVVSSASGLTAMLVRGASGQSVNIQEWQNSAGTVLANITPNGGLTAIHVISLGTSPPGNGTVRIGSVATNQVGIAVKGFASQTANLAEFQNSSGGIVASIASSGALTVAGAIQAINTTLNGASMFRVDDSTNTPSKFAFGGNIGSIGYRTLEVGAADSAGAGFRTVRTTN